MNTEDTVARNWLTKEETEAFVGKNSTFYLEKWGSHNTSALKGWNWSALFFGVTWMVYRKMYIEILILLILPTLGVVALILIGFGSSHTLWIVLATASAGIGRFIPLVLGIVGNALYRKKALRAIKITKDMSEIERIKLLGNMGGVSKVGVVVFTILGIILSIAPFIMIAI